MAAPRVPTPPGRSARAYPLIWIENTFNSKERTESLLRPEVENGNVTYHDMDLAQAFFSSNKRYLPFFYSGLAFLGTFAYSQRFARPKWRLTKLVAISTFLGIGSYTFGFNQKLTAHFKFARSLEDPAGFNRALRNVNVRLGGPERFPYGVPERQEELMGIVPGPIATLSKGSDVSGPPLETTEPGERWAGEATQGSESDQNQTRQIDQPRVQRPPGKWDEIRAANNKAGSASSWDLIRQNHERNKISPPPSSSTRSRDPIGGATEAGGSYDRDNSSDLDPPTATDENAKRWDGRASDESRFEAVLEAERRRASRA